MTEFKSSCNTFSLGISIQNKTTTKTKIEEEEEEERRKANILSVVGKSSGELCFNGSECLNTKYQIEK